MNTIRKKTWPLYFEKVLSGEKNYEFRLADFEVSAGDTLILEEWNPDTREYTGRTITKKVTYVKRFDLNDFGQRRELEKHGIFGISLE